MGLSSNSIMHFTNSADSLKGILKEGFRVKYCLENVETPNGALHYSIPMVSFCDIPLSEMKAHILKYGGYGIGLKREWAQLNGLNPVLYIDSKSTLGAGFHTSFYSMFKDKKISELTEIDDNFVDVIRYMKNYEGKLIRGSVENLAYRFADEKEWRYVPGRKLAPQILIRGTVLTPERKLKLNNNISGLRLPFEPKDIKYIIINDDSEIGEIIDCLRSAFSNSSLMDIERLFSRITTTEQIITDF
ncbi:abortive infection system antitoxin AbiGi family protein [Pedobacter sp. CFBP9032]|uniref:abortive infection system antitoxin AbiGi family protein n=1 Tax=Pedobacter sp. CFBP9032 TaxID=3096539 RepID=UPI002A69FCF4|nr:abortive infection system antitoxin AbiGi family protein [Pedobacter sp. CFBP9032]MDY0904071.1 abortive infection system antitoxin AbiGi family protein [Pedobacter sp. CFBP9032]